MEQELKLWEIVGSNITVASILIIWVRHLIVEKKELIASHNAERQLWAQALKEKDADTKDLNKQIRTDAQGTLDILKSFEKTIETTSLKDTQERNETFVLMRNILSTTKNIARKMGMDPGE